MDLADRDLTAYLTHFHPDVVSFSVDEQSTHMSSRQGESVNHIWRKTRHPTVLCSIAMVSQFAAGEHLKKVLDILGCSEEIRVFQA